MAYREKVTIVRADEIATDIYEMCFSTNKAGTVRVCLF